MALDRTPRREVPYRIMRYARGVRSPFGYFATIVVAWEVAAVITEDMHEAGFRVRRIPYITEVLRALPRPFRTLALFAISLVLWEHTEQMRLTKLAHQRALGLLGPRALARSATVVVDAGDLGELDAQ